MPIYEIVIFGTGDFAQIAHAYLTEDSPYTIVAFTIDTERMADPHVAGLSVVPFDRITSEFPPERYKMFVAVGYSKVNRARAGVYERCKGLGYELISYVSSRAMRTGPVTMGDNCFIFESNVLQPFVRIGNDVVMWSGNHVGHHSTIEDHCFIASHAVISSRVTVRRSTFIGVNATIRDGVTIAPECVIGAGALIMRDTVPGGVYAVHGTEPGAVKSWELRRF